MKKLYLAIFICFLLCLSGCGRAETFFESVKGSDTEVTEAAEAESTPQDTSLDEEPEVVGYEAEADEVARISADEAETKPPVNEDADGDEDNEYVSPIDFYELWDQNEEIIAWLSIPGTNISYPVCQHYEDDAYYLKHNSKGKWDINGALFTENKYNLQDFSDPVNVIYGHNMKSGKMFGYLEETYRDGFDGRDEAIVYLPNKEIHYKLFAAIPVSNKHLLAGKNLYKEYPFEVFAHNLLATKSLEAVIDRSVEVEYGDQLLILSTCMGNKPDQRYIVIGKKVD